MPRDTFARVLDRLEHNATQLAEARRDFQKANQDYCMAETKRQKLEAYFRLIGKTADGEDPFKGLGEKAKLERIRHLAKSALAGDDPASEPPF